MSNDPKDFDPSLVEMEGQSRLIIGRGRTGKTGFALFLIRKTKPVKWLIVVNRITNPQLFKYQFCDEPIYEPDELVGIWNKCETDALVVIVPRRGRGDHRKSIWEILQADQFRDFTIFGDELASLNRESEDEKAFNDFIRTVGQQNQQFYGATHRIADDVEPVIPQNVEKIYYVGRTMDAKEVDILYGLSNRSFEMTKQEFAENLARLSEKFNWWSDHPDLDGVFEVYT